MEDKCALTVRQPWVVLQEYFDIWTVVVVGDKEGSRPIDGW